MATERFSVDHTAGKTVYFRFMDASDKIFDFFDDTWKANLAACTDPKLAATEKTDFGDADESTYVASLDLARLYNTATAKMFHVQAMDDLATDEIITTDEIWIYSGARVAIESLSETESNIRGADNDDLKDLSDQLDGLVPGAAVNLQIADKAITIT